MTEIADKLLTEIIARSRSASRKSYAPYSRFPVGAAILTEGQRVYEGCNVENASFGLTICAERNAVFHMVATRLERILAIAIYTPTDKPSAPCGACRQVINEFGPGALVISVCDSTDKLIKTLSDLLPDAFGSANLAGGTPK